VSNLLFLEFTYPMSLNQTSFLNTPSIMRCLKVPIYQLSLTSCVYTGHKQELSYVDENVVAFLQFMLMQTSSFQYNKEANMKWPDQINNIPYLKYMFGYTDIKIKIS
jgi:hypothetical protein